MTKQSIQRLVLWFLLIAVCIIILLSVNVAYSNISYRYVIDSLLNPQGVDSSTVLLHIRLPRIILAFICGMGLALSGCILQTVTGNQLADPGILGINAGAGFMVMLFLTFFPSLHISTMVYQPIFAMIGGLLVAWILYIFSKRSGKVRPSYLLLGGIAVSAGFTAIMTIMASNMDNSSYQLVYRWLSGNIWGTSWYQVKALIPYLLVFIPILFTKANVLDVLLLGEEASLALGVRVERERRILLIVSVALAASCVSVSGGISFIGLVGPHIARRYIGARHRMLIPISMLIGGLLLLMADTIGRSLFQPIEIPVGIVISVLAAPYFLYLLRKQIGR
ncbi:fecCD transport family protein [Clostridium argentinense CDC 2741]|uniref:FecCD transport family protein n=1 Tax=Clostridium argentinense CDC 2741 TaxID=1418104 RepID=A0A0C1UM42_9CLOT|nr:iron ABC transporter permease [Clostridium argentinense]ARC84824.1 iron ABC transporter permease [Clostridium argentinense]KIE48295.1 fecCD transport family protein [Clostridium argentinense CDC 2741]NFF41140.1 iron ABC transporter permease [Clostridium argentinense]NFP51578.1 iron ABC transporter permease [Clostridium argentinense]NFP74057.1 iron ABC transporter permease [Clostridium argentinense]